MRPFDQRNKILINFAQDWCGRTNADMSYQLLPIQLNQKLQERGQSCKLTVVNLAMAASHMRNWTML